MISTIESTLEPTFEATSQHRIVFGYFKGENKETSKHDWSLSYSQPPGNGPMWLLAVVTVLTLPVLQSLLPAANQDEAVSSTRKLYEDEDGISSPEEEARFASISGPTSKISIIVSLAVAIGLSAAVSELGSGSTKNLFTVFIIASWVRPPSPLSSCRQGLEVHVLKLMLDVRSSWSASRRSRSTWILDRQRGSPWQILALYLPPPSSSTLRLHVDKLGYRETSIPAVTNGSKCLLPSQPWLHYCRCHGDQWSFTRAAAWTRSTGYPSCQDIPSPGYHISTLWPRPGRLLRHGVPERRPGGGRSDDLYVAGRRGP